MIRGERENGQVHLPSRGDLLAHEDLKMVFGKEYRFVIGKALYKLGLVPRTGIGPWHFPGSIHAYEDQRSEAQYLLEYDIPSVTIEGETDRVYVSVLNGNSSTHDHPAPVREEYYPLKGTFYINRRTLSPGEIYVVESGVQHQASTNDNQWALFIIVTRNIATIYPDQLHRARPSFSHRSLP